MKLVNKLKKRAHEKALKSHVNTNKAFKEVHINLFDKIHTRQTDTLHNSNGMIMSMWQYTKLL